MRLSSQTATVKSIALQCIRRRPVQFALIIITIVVGAGISLLPALATKFIIDDGLGKHHYEAVVKWCAISLTVTIIGSGVALLQGHVVSLLSSEMSAAIRQRLARNLLRTSFDFFLDTRSGAVVNRVTGDVEALERLLSATALNVANQCAAIALTVVALFYLDVRLTAIAIVAAGLVFVPAQFLNKMQYGLAIGQRKRRDDVAAAFGEILSTGGAYLSKLFGTSSVELARLSLADDALRRANLASDMAYRAMTSAIGLAIAVGPVVMWLVGAIFVIRGGVSIGGLVAFAVLLARLYQPVAGITAMVGSLSAGRAIAERLDEYLGLPDEDRSGAHSSTFPRADITLSDVTVQYADGSIPVLRSIDLQIYEGEYIAVVGASGSGKSTLLNVILGICRPSEGRVLLGGHSIEEANIEDWRAVMTAVPQHIFMLHASIRENVRCARPAASDDDIWEALGTASLRDVVRSLPHQLDTVIGENGLRLSGGQRQRIALARAALRDARVLLLDEATSNLDGGSEAHVLRMMHQRFAKSTRIVVAHRIRNVMNADRIVVLERGEVTDCGGHDVLMQRSSAYRDMVSQQEAAHPRATILEAT
ncbi:MAG: ABC transporter ATP-binding protein/permease [Candidatus Eremiobacteraeota bacterium]|nr:ABC transporter ATP-binding protein/permease [Candidatus Eremiobacteraeota bacterium]